MCSFGSNAVFNNHKLFHKFKTILQVIAWPALHLIFTITPNYSEKSCRLDSSKEVLAIKSEGTDIKLAYILESPTV